MSRSDRVRLVLGSRSPARLSTLRNAGVDPIVVVSNLDEDALLATLDPAATPEQIVGALALGKAMEVAEGLSTEIKRDKVDDRTRLVVLGCDSMLHINGRMVGKPHSPEVAKERIREMRGGDAVLWTGHAVVEVSEDGAVGSPQVASASTIVHFGDISDEEIDAYVASGEPLEVAGSFTIDGLGGPFIRGVTGDPHSVVGVSLPLLRDLVSRLGIFWPDFWTSK